MIESDKKFKAVLWDFGGVITSSPFEAFARYEKENGLAPDFIRTINANNPDQNAWARFERSEIDADQFDQDFLQEAKARGAAVRGRDVLALLAGNVRPEMVQVLKGLRARDYVIACITNNVKSGEGAGMARNKTSAAQVAEIMTLFDKVFESSRIGIRKPDSAIYLHATKTLELQPKDCVFLDDLGINLKPARALGMATIKVSSATQAIAELAALLGHDLP